MTGGEHLVQESAEALDSATFGDVVLAGGGLGLRAGEIVGLAGLEGQGQDDYLRALRGPGTAFVARDRHEESIFPPLSFRETSPPPRWVRTPGSA